MEADETLSKSAARHNPACFARFCRHRRLTLLQLGKAGILHMRIDRNLFNFDFLSLLYSLHFVSVR
jgi:hypothetical protein